MADSECLAGSSFGLLRYTLIELLFILVPVSRSSLRSQFLRQCSVRTQRSLELLKRYRWRSPASGVLTLGRTLECFERYQRVEV